MKVLHVIPSLSPTQGGPSFALPLMERALAGTDVELTVVTTDDDGPGGHANVSLGQPVPGEWSTRWYFRKQTEFYKISWPLARWLEQHVREFDVVHVHALFSFASTLAARAARRHDVPYIIRPLGVLNRWGLTQRRARLKAFSQRWIEGPNLRAAAAMHYTSRAEQREAEAAGATAHAVVIPLGVDTEAFAQLPAPELFHQAFPSTRGKKIILFLSRLDAKKGLDQLLPAFAEVKKLFPDACLVLAGAGAPDFVRSLRAQAESLGMAERIIWPGFLGGEMKCAALAAATIFVLPSYSENFGIALVEALAAGCACVTTTGVAAAEGLPTAGAGLVVEPNAGALADALLGLLANEPLRLEMAARARTFAAEQYSLAAMGRGLNELYCQIAKSK